MNQQESTVHKGRAGIDPLYTQIFLLAFPDVETPIFDNLGRVLGAVVLAFNPLSAGQITKILYINASVATMLRHCTQSFSFPRKILRKFAFSTNYPRTSCRTPTVVAIRGSSSTLPSTMEI